MPLLLSCPDTRALENPLSNTLWQSEDGLSLRVFTGEEARAYLEPIAAMRIRFFREFPYLYEGSLDYETAYLETYFQSPNSRILLVFKDGKVVGFSNVIPLNEELPEIKSELLGKGLHKDVYFYIGEVMLDPICRGQGLVRRFFAFHEAYAQQRGCSKLVFMTVQRPEQHPERPMGYEGPDSIWRHFGYAKLPDIFIKMPWSQVDTGQEELNTLDIWLKDLNESPPTQILS